MKNVNDGLDVASACYLQGKNNDKATPNRQRWLHLPAICKVKTTYSQVQRQKCWLHLPAICKVKTTTASFTVLEVKLHLPAICKVKTTSLKSIK